MASDDNFGQIAVFCAVAVVCLGILGVQCVDARSDEHIPRLKKAVELYGFTNVEVGDNVDVLDGACGKDPVCRIFVARNAQGATARGFVGCGVGWTSCSKACTVRVEP